MSVVSGKRWSSSAARSHRPECLLFSRHFASSLNTIVYKQSNLILIYSTSKLNALFLFSAVDGGYTQWSMWSLCSASCGVGTQTRSKTCTAPPPRVRGDDCKGEYSEVRSCSQVYCPVGKYGIYVTIRTISVLSGNTSGIQLQLKHCFFFPLDFQYMKTTILRE